MMISKVALLSFKTETLIDLFEYYAEQHTAAHNIFEFTYDDSVFDDYYEEIGYLLDDLQDILLNDRKEEYEEIMLNKRI